MVAEVRTVISINFVLETREYSNRFPVVVVEQSGQNEERTAKMALHYCTLLHLAVFH